MAVHEAKLLSKQDVAWETTAFHFSKPDGFVFRPGQALDLILSDAGDPGAQGDRHAFSLVSAPFQDDLCITTRMRDSAYKRRLKALQPGALVGLDGPFGSLTLHNKAARAAVFIAGGIGVTPFMSILRHAAHENLPQPLLLLYSNRRPEDAAFLSELRELERRHSKFRMVATMTQMAGSAQSWTGETGLLEERMLKRAIGDLPSPVVYVAGPPAMVESLRTALELAGIDEDDIRSEEFYGY